MMLEQDCKKIDTKIFDWISKNIITEPFEKVGNPIRRFIPPYFECYCKILHPFVIDIDAPDTRYNEKEEEIKEELLLIKRMYDKLNLKDINLLNLKLESFIDSAAELVLKKHNQNSELLFKHPKDLPQGQLKNDLEVLLKEPLIDICNKFGETHPIHGRIFSDVKNRKKVGWEEIAKQYDLQFHHNISPITFSKKFENIGFPLNLYFPSCSLDREDCDKLLRILKKISKEQKVLINSYSDNYQICPIERMIRQDENNALNGGYIVDSNHDWIIYADDYRDLQMTILGGSKLLIDTLKSDTDLEIVECSEFSRVDHFSDILN